MKTGTELITNEKKKRPPVCLFSQDVAICRDIGRPYSTAEIRRFRREMRQSALVEHRGEKANTEEKHDDG